MTQTLLVTDTARAASLEEQRKCSECSACCVLPRIPELDKRGYSPCLHLQTPVPGSGCCRVYSDRPEVCSDYRCLWRAGMLEGDERRRPDKLGLMFAIDLVDGNPYIECWELWEGAAREHPGRGALEAMAAQTPVLVRWYGVPCSLRYRGPDSLDFGGVLSRWAREDPNRLAKWVDEQTTWGKLETPDPAATRDLDTFRRGEPMRPTFGRDGRLVLPTVAP